MGWFRDGDGVCVGVVVVVVVVLVCVVIVVWRRGSGGPYGQLLELRSSFLLGTRLACPSGCIHVCLFTCVRVRVWFMEYLSAAACLLYVANARFQVKICRIFVLS